jgi:hypothetical protein
LPGVFEGYCPPHYKNMREAAEALPNQLFISKIRSMNVESTKYLDKTYFIIIFV